MSKLESNWQFAEQYPVETAAMISARHLSLEYGIEPLSRALAAQVANIAAISRASHICELGTGVGLSGLALLRYNNAHLTSIDIEPEYHRHAKPLFAKAGITPSRLRLIEGDAASVLPRLNHGAYDLVLIDANPGGILNYVEHGLQVIKPGGSLLIPNALRGGNLPNPAARDQVTQEFRDLLNIMVESPAVSASLSPIGNGLLTLTRLA